MDPDICQISRIYGILRGPRRTRFINRILAPEELRRYDSRLNSLKDAIIRREVQNGDQRETGLWKTAAFIAGRFAAKEAAMKAHSHRKLTFHDVVIERRVGKEERLGSGPPVARIKAGEGQGEDVSALISISHDGDYATAVCIAHDPTS
ncbi:hypothetical protein QQS21_009877 [Conoideocrella luteorostrata]|uniref:4'-phosphopantetheinyl transferase domain-containing protein n=1 Tax=Conoideocrella luteorostrata TaxID=1105319 RepID=A0AAJ0FXE3_9HYPO|nr:hypothetical protein QQS21_009877 [Conoideocrella luteorostrata]